VSSDVGGVQTRGHRKLYRAAENDEQRAATTEPTLERAKAEREAKGSDSAALASRHRCAVKPLRTLLSCTAIAPLFSLTRYTTSTTSIAPFSASQSPTEPELRLASSNHHLSLRYSSSARRGHVLGIIKITRRYRTERQRAAFYYSDPKSLLLLPLCPQSRVSQLSPDVLQQASDSVWRALAFPGRVSPIVDLN
jgi:hypothetical protein